MATILDSLVVTLGLNDKDFKAGTKRAEKSLKDVGAESKKTDSSIKSVTQTAAKFLVVLGGVAAIKNFVQSTVLANASLVSLSKNLSLSVAELSAWGRAAEVSGGSASGLQGALKTLTNAQTDLQLKGESGLVPYFSALGVSMADMEGKARPVTDVLLDLADRFSQMDRQTAANMGGMMGLDEGTVNLLLRGRKEVESLIEEQKKQGAVSDKQAQEAEKTRIAFVKLKQEYQAMAAQVMTDLLPAMRSIMEVLQTLSSIINQDPERAKRLFTVITIGIGAVVALTNPFAAAVAALTALSAIFVAADKSAIDGFFDSISKGIDDLIKRYPLLKPIAAAITAVAGFLGGGPDGAGLGGGAGSQEYVAARKSGAYQNKYDKMQAPTAGSQAVGGKAGSAMSFFQAKGWTKAQAAGIVANLKKESNFNERAVGDSGRAYGIAQWHPDRQANFRAAFGKDIRDSSFQEQLEFIQFELTKGKERGAGERLRGAGTAAQAGDVFSRHYERPLLKEQEARARAAEAERIYAQGSRLSGAGDLVASSYPLRSAGATTNNQATSNKTQNIKNDITIYTAATDAAGIAKDMGPSLNYLFATQANAGLN